MQLLGRMIQEMNTSNFVHIIWITVVHIWVVHLHCMLKKYKFNVSAQAVELYIVVSSNPVQFLGIIWVILMQ